MTDKILTRPLERKLAWQNFGGPCEYAKSGTKRVTYWLRLGKDARKITSATPSKYDAMASALYNGKRMPGLENYSFSAARVEAAELALKRADVPPLTPGFREFLAANPEYAELMTEGAT